MRLLLAEDELALSKALTAILERNNYSVDAAYDGQEALEYLEADNYDGVILDIMMPKVDGITVLKEIRKRGNLIPVLLLTAKSEVDDKVLGLELGADEIGRLISEARLSGNYEYVIADLEFGMDRASLQILRQAGAIVWTGDGSEISNRKLARAYQALAILEQNAEVPLTARIALIYNKFSNKSGIIGTERCQNAFICCRSIYRG